MGPSTFRAPLRQPASAHLASSTCDSPPRLTNTTRLSPAFLVACDSPSHCPRASFPPLTYIPFLLAASAWSRHQAGPAYTFLTTPSSAVKRKASELGDKLATPESPRKKKTPESAPESALPATPATNASGNMDSDDDFNSSQVSEDEFMEDQDSDVVSLGDGKACLSHAQAAATLTCGV